MIFNEFESTVLEFKREIPRNNQIIKTAIGFCNLYGGRIIIGVDDSRSIVGVDESAIDHILESLHKSIYESSTPSIFPKIYSQRIKDRIVLVIEIAEGMSKPYYRTAEGVENGTYIRMGRTTIKASSDIIQELQWQGKGKHFDETPVYGADSSDLDENGILNFLRIRKHDFEDAITDKILIAYKLLIQQQSRFFPTVGAILLFGKNPQEFLSESFIICTHFEGTAGRKALATVDCTGNLFQQADEALQFILSRLHKSFIINGLHRNETLEIPEVAIREILINAVVHRNYSINGPTKIAIYEDRLEIFSPGLFPGPLDVNNLEQGITYIRNSVISKIFREAGIMEKLGSGFISLFSSYREWGLEKPTVIEGMNFVKCILPRRIENKTFWPDVNPVGSIKERESYFNPSHVIAGDASSDYDAILDLFQSFDKVTMTLVLRSTGLARATAGRRLKWLLDNGRIEKVGAGRYCYYLKSPSD